MRTRSRSGAIAIPCAGRSLTRRRSTRPRSHHEVFQAWLTFALFDIARRGHLGIEPDAYRHDIGAVLAPMTEVAAANPNAWFPEVLSVDELITATPSNRMVGYPYTKRMISVMDVDMAAAVVVATEGAADALGVPRDRRVYLRGWGWATDPNYVAEHARLWESPAMRAAAGAAFDGAGVGVDDIGHLDLYSCFGSSLFLALDALGLDASDSRGVTVTGGLPFAGGPANNYLGHALASMVEVLRGDAGSYGMVSGVGMHMTKHTYALYSTTPGSVAPPDDAAVQKEVEAVAPPGGHHRPRPRDRPRWPPTRWCTTVTAAGHGDWSSPISPMAPAVTPGSPTPSFWPTWRHRSGWAPPSSSTPTAR